MGLYSYTITAISEWGFESAPSDAAQIEFGDVTAPEPIVLSGQVQNTDAQLSWTASTASDFSAYHLYRDDALVVSVSGVANTSYVDAQLPDATYDYTIRVADHAGNESTPSNTVTLTVAASNLLPPENLTVEASEFAMRLQWEAGDALATGYRIERQSQGSSFGDWGSSSFTQWNDYSCGFGHRVLLPRVRSGCDWQ